MNNTQTTPKPLPFSQMASRLDAPEDDVWTIHYEAVRRAEAGEDIVLMSVGDPDFATPDDIIETLVSQIRKGRTHYSPAAGEMELRTAIAELETTATGRQFSPEQFVILPGATAAVYGTLASIVNPGDQVIIPEPMYIGYRGIIKALDIDVVPLPLDIRGDCALSVESVTAAITDKTRAVLVNTPGNPFGNIIPPETLSELAAVLRERGIWFICDEVYSLFTFDDPHVSLLKCAEHLDNIVVIDGLSKSHAMTGWRIGWVCSPPEMTRALTAYAGTAFFGCSQFIQDAAAYALKTNGPHVDHMCEAYRTRRDAMVGRIQAANNLSCVVPKAGMFLMMDISQVAESGGEFARGLLESEGVSVIPGAGFGDNAQDFVRLTLTHNLDVIEDAMDRITRYVS